MTRLLATYEPESLETAVYRTWMEHKAFHADPAAGGDPYTIVIPPPNVTGALHLGHAIDNTLQDILIRRKRMQGYNTLWMPGIDHAGIATQAVVEKELKEKENKTRHDIGREALVERIWKWKEQYGNRIIEQLKRMGASCDWDRSRFTLDEVCARAVRETFFSMFADGLIYRDERLVNWDMHLGTAVADDEVYHESVSGGFWTFRYPVKDLAGEFIEFSTTRPETMLGDTAVAVHPDDPRYKHLIGKMVTIPLVDRDIPIIADGILVDPKLGTGAVKVTPAHDKNDYECGLRNRLPKINILTRDGKISAHGTVYDGMLIADARDRVVHDMRSLGLFQRHEPRVIDLAHSDRSKTPIEPFLSEEWFVRTSLLATSAIDAVDAGRVSFFPSRYEKTYRDWLGERRDWCVSRQLWWGHRIPVWYLDLDIPGDGYQAMPAQERYEYLERATATVNRFLTAANVRKATATRPDLAHARLLVCTQTDDADRVLRTLCTYINWVHHPYHEPQPERALSELPATIPAAIQLKRDCVLYSGHQDGDVLDTWFSSALWPHSTLGWPQKTAELARYYPTSVLVTGRDIITLWVARMVMMGLYNTDKSPFHHVHIHPTILDGKGERMSKSKGNGVDPVDIIETHGADALRFTLTHMATETQDVRMQIARDSAGRNTSDKFDFGRAFCNKLWNASRLVWTNLCYIPPAEAEEGKWSLMDRWILSRIQRTIHACDEAIDGYHFDRYAKACYDFFWRDFCDWYLEAIKPELKEHAPRRYVVGNVLAAVIDASLRLFHPVVPFITEAVWSELNRIRRKRDLPNFELPYCDLLIRAKWPKQNEALIDHEAEAVFGRIQELISAIRNLRNEHKVDPKRTVTVSISAPGESAGQVAENKATVELLALCTVKAVAADLPPVADAARATAAGCEIFIEGLVDQAAEAQRLGKRREELSRQIAAMKGRLANKAYVDKAPAHLVKQTQDQLAEAEAELAKLG